MSDFSQKYATNKNSEIIIAKNNVFVRFKPFIESYSVEVKNNFLQVTSVDNITAKTTGTKERRYKISFNVPGLDQSDARVNHQKFQKLMRMCMPESLSRDNSIYVKFANLIKKDVENPGSDSDYDNFTKNLGVRCKVGSLNYSPDMDLGFFDEAGMFFAKNFKIDLDLEIYSDSFPRKKKYKKAKISDTQVEKINPGNLYGFKVKYNLPPKKKKE